MPVAPKVYDDPDDVPTRLAALGLTVDDLHQAIRYGYLARLGCNANDPAGFAGITLWARTTRGLRERLAPAGWKKKDGKLATVVNENETVAIVVSTGDDDTGIATGAPKTKFAKGPATAEAVEANAQGELFPLSEVLTENPVTWVLLISVERAADKTVIRSELSRPAELDLDGRIGSWYERIVLPSMVDDDDRGSRDEPEPGPEFDVDVRRRAG